LDNTVRNWNIGGVVVLVAASISLIVWRAHHAPGTTEPYPLGVVRDIANDQLEDSWLFMNWTVANWFLTLLAAGTAIGAAIKNAFSARNQANAQAVATIQATKDNKPVPPASIQPSGYIDGWVMTLAALTVVATTLSSTIHAGVEADHYRQADLKLQDALLDWKYNQKTDQLVATWHEAQRIIAGVTVVPPPATPPAAVNPPKPNDSTTNPSQQKAPVPPVTTPPVKN
jgi:hypothetical protein